MFPLRRCAQRLRLRSREWGSRGAFAFRRQRVPGRWREDTCPKTRIRLQCPSQSLPWILPFCFSAGQEGRSSSSLALRRMEGPRQSTGSPASTAGEAHWVLCCAPDLGRLDMQRPLAAGPSWCRDLKPLRDRSTGLL